MIKILTVIRYPVGGIRTYLKYTYGALNQNKYQFTVLTVSGYEADIIKEDLNSFKIEIIEVKESRFIVAMLYHILIMKFKKTFDLIHSHGFTAGGLSNLTNLLFKKPHIITLHSVFFEENHVSNRFGSLKKYLLGKLLSLADVIQSVSYDAQENLIKNIPLLSKQKEKLVVIANGISIDQLCNQTETVNLSLKDEIQIGEDTILFGFLGRFMPQKGFNYLIDAVEELSKDRNFSKRFKILAVNDKAYMNRYRVLIEKKNISNYFNFYGFTLNVKRIIKGLDAVVIPSLWEAGPLLPMEAFVLGCPVIASNCIGLREVIEATPALVIKKIADSKSIAEGLAYFMNNSMQLGKDALAYVPKATERFDVKVSSAQLDAIFQNLVK